MPAELLIVAVPQVAYATKGDIAELAPGGTPWGAKQGLPNFVQVTITDRTMEQVQAYLQSVRQLINYAIVSQNANGVRADISVDQALSGAINLTLKQQMVDYILSGAGTSTPVTQVTGGTTATNLRVDIELPDDENRIPTLQAMKFNINSELSEVIAYRRYRFESGAVDSVVAQGGAWSGTAAQAAASIIDKLNPV